MRAPFSGRLQADPASERTKTGERGFFERLKARRRRAKRTRTVLRLLRRYTNADFKTNLQWQQWLARNRERLFFSDFGGYKFYAIPEGYPRVTGPDPNAEPFWFPR